MVNGKLLPWGRLLMSEELRAKLKLKGFSKSRISPLLRTGSAQGKACTSAARPALTLDQLRQLGKASALDVLRRATEEHQHVLGRLSCRHLMYCCACGVHTCTVRVHEYFCTGTGGGGGP